MRTGVPFWGYQTYSASPDYDEFVNLLQGRELTDMPLSEDEKDRIREIERIRGEVQRESMAEMQPFKGPVVGQCKSCGQDQRIGWEYCPAANRLPAHARDA